MAFFLQYFLDIFRGNFIFLTDFFKDFRSGDFRSGDFRSGDFRSGDFRMDFAIFYFRLKIVNLNMTFLVRLFHKKPF